MPVGIRGDKKAKKIKEQILGKPLSANDSSKASKIVQEHQKQLYTKYKK